LIQEPVILTNAIHKAASISGHDAWKFVEPLVYAGDVVVQELLGDPEELVDSICRKRKVTQQSQPQRQVVGVEGGGEEENLIRRSGFMRRMGGMNGLLNLRVGHIITIQVQGCRNGTIRMDL